MFGIPVRETKTTVRFGASDLFGFGCSMNPVTRPIQTDPGCSDGIIRSGWNGEFASNLFRLGGFREDFWIETIGRIPGRFENVQNADGTFFDTRGDTAGKMGDQVRRGAEDIECFRIEMDPNKSRALSYGRRVETWDFD